MHVREDVVAVQEAAATADLSRGPLLSGGHEVDETNADALRGPSHPLAGKNMQGELFSNHLRGSGPEGWAYEPDFLSASEEGELLACIQGLPLAPMRYKEYAARRRGISFGGHFDFDANRLMPSPAIPGALMPLLHKAAAWLGRPPESFIQVFGRRVSTGRATGLASRCPRLRGCGGCLIGWRGRAGVPALPSPHAL